jgi:hypothetical protein
MGCNLEIGRPNDVKLTTESLFFPQAPFEAFARLRRESLGRETLFVFLVPV